jgi:inosine triphosphate pyrophosphatase
VDADASCATDAECIYFVTSNPRKEREVNAILDAANIPFRVSHVDLDLPEYQGLPEYIAHHKCLEASKQLMGCPVLVEDTSLCFNALNGLPGPYIKWFWDSLGDHGLYSLLAGHEDKSAYCQCVLAFSPGPGIEPLLWIGRTDGVVIAPVGDGGFGWDSIFIPNCKDKPFGAMPESEKNEISHRSRALAQFIEHCRVNQAQVRAELTGSVTPSASAGSGTSAPIDASPVAGAE